MKKILFVLLLLATTCASALEGTCDTRNSPVEEIKLLSDKKLVSYMCECLTKGFALRATDLMKTSLGVSIHGVITDNSQRAHLVMQNRPNAKKMENSTTTCLNKNRN